MRSDIIKATAILAGLATFVLVGTAAAQIRVDTSGGGFYNALGSAQPRSGDISGTNDLMVSSAIEVGGALYLSRSLFMSRDLFAPSSGDQTIYFADGGIQTDELIQWDDSADAFRFTDDLVMFGTRRITADGEGVLRLRSEHPAMHFILDSDNDNALTTQHQFVWYNNGVATNLRVMQLQSSEADVGDLFIDGQLSQNTFFDLAESFWQSAPVEPGDLVSVDPNRPDAVLPTHGAEDHAVLGVVRTRPAIVMGGSRSPSNGFERPGATRWPPPSERRGPGSRRRSWPPIPTWRSSEID